MTALPQCPPKTPKTPLSVHKFINRAKFFVFLPVAALVWWITATALSAATVHVSPSGNDSNPGTVDQPVAGLRKALDLVLVKPEPCEIIIHAGVYPGAVQVGRIEDRHVGPLPLLVISAAKKSDGRFEEVWFDGGHKITKTEPVQGKAGVYKMPGTFNLRSTRPQTWETDTRTRYELVADLAAVEQFPASIWCNEAEIFLHTSDGRPPETHDMGITRDGDGIMVWRQNTSLRGLRFRNFLSWTWSSGPTLRASNTTVEDCHARNCVRGFQLLCWGPDPDLPENMRILRCSTEDCAGGVYLSGKHGIVEDCRFIQTRDKFMIPVYPQDDCAIQFYHPAFEGEVRRNLCVGFANGIFMKCPTSEFIAEYNTGLDGTTHGIGCTSWHPKSVFRYNIVTGFAWPILCPQDLKPTNIVDYSCFWQNREKNALKQCLDAARKARTGGHIVIADPRFAGPAVGDYRLLPDSPCLKMGPNGETCGVFGTVGPDFKEVQPPMVTFTLAPPAARTGGSGELYFERDPWIGGGRNLIRQLPPENRADEWVTADSQLGLLIGAESAINKPGQMKIRIGSGAWGAPEPYATWKEVPFPRNASMTALSVTVSDSAGNWSGPKTLVVRRLAQGPKLKGAPVVYANDFGVVISFEADSPCLARIEFGADKNYGSVFEQPKDVQRSWIAGDGGDWVEIRSKPRVTNYLVLLKPTVATGKTYHYRLSLQDELGNKTVTDDATFTVMGATRSYFVSPSGKDTDGRGGRENPWRTIQFAVDRALPGDRVVLLPGLYPGEVKLTHGGLNDAPITLESDQPDTVTLDGRHEATACLRLENAPCVVIKGFEIRWFAHSGVYATDSPNITVANCRIWNGFWSGWPIGSGVFAYRSPGLVADHNVLYQFEQGIYLLQSPRSRVMSNTILGNMYGAVHFTYSAAGTVSRNNCFAYGGNEQYTVTCGDPKELETFDSDYNNLGTKLRDSAPKEKSDQADEIAAERFEPKDKFFKNHGSKGVIALDGKRFYSLKSWQEATKKDLHSIFKDPIYVNPERWDYRLQPGSPNIGAGAGGTNIGALGVKAK